jgi:hypothetical protein
MYVDCGACTHFAAVAFACYAQENEMTCGSKKVAVCWVHTATCHFSKITCFECLTHHGSLSASSAALHLLPQKRPHCQSQAAQGLPAPAAALPPNAQVGCTADLLYGHAVQDQQPLRQLQQCRPASKRRKQSVAAAAAAGWFMCQL